MHAITYRSVGSIVKAQVLHAERKICGSFLAGPVMWSTQPHNIVSLKAFHRCNGSSKLCSQGIRNGDGPTSCFGLGTILQVGLYRRFFNHYHLRIVNDRLLF